MLQILQKHLLRQILCRDNVCKYSTAVTKPKAVREKNELLISCKRKEFDFYTNTKYKSLDNVPLASKGWTHSKSVGDSFTILPLRENEQDYYKESFSTFNIDSKIVKALQEEGIKYATEFQSRAIPAIQKGNHVLLAAETGCGKTVSYLLPIIQQLIDIKCEGMNTPTAVVIVPNRELAYQIGEVAQILCESVGIRSKIVVGGRVKNMMMNPEFEEIDLLVATPGALSKLSTVGVYKLHNVQFTVLDEADTLIDDSFIERMTVLIKRLSNSQMILVSATLPKKLPDVLYPYECSMKQILSPKLHMPLLNVIQKFVRIRKSDRPAHLLRLAKSTKSPLLVFSNRNQTCDWISMFLRENGISCSNINGEMNYAIRIEQWNQFVRGETMVLSATDVGSRGLNTIQVKHVLNYDFPKYASDYLHRVGRVGRIGSAQDCKITNFIASDWEIPLVHQIETAVRKDEPIPNVDGNITAIVQKKILRNIRETP